MRRAFATVCHSTIWNLDEAQNPWNGECFEFTANCCAYAALRATWNIVPGVAFSELKSKEHAMLKWALIFLVISIVAGFLGFSGVSAATATIAKILFFVALLVFLVFLVLAIMAGSMAF